MVALLVLRKQLLQPGEAVQVGHVHFRGKQLVALVLAVNGDQQGTYELEHGDGGGGAV